MSKNTKIVSPALLALAVLITLTLKGCLVVGGTTKLDDQISEKSVKQITAGKTTKSEILEWFGPPTAIARRGKSLAIPDADFDGTRTVDSETFFELFSIKHDLTEDHIIYYYQSFKVGSTAGIFLFVGSESKKVHSSKIWMLINNNTGIVEDYVYKKT